MAIIAGMAYCIKSFPIFSVPSAVGVFCPVIPIVLRAQRYKKETDYRIYEKSFVFLPPKLS
jgi:hypothetical protein